MHGYIQFTTTEQLASFLKAFVGCTAKFEVTRATDGFGWVLRFTGGF